MDIDQMIHMTARVVEVAGIAVMLAGILLSGGAFARDWLASNLGEAYHRLRANLGRAILLGLEFLVAGDIIATVAVEPTIENILVLGIIVLIRTFLSLALEMEISGQLPWRRKRSGTLHEPPEASAAG